MKTRYETMQIIKSSNLELESSISALKPSYCYSVEELLRLRAALPFVKCNIHVLSKIPDIASLFRLPSEVFKNPRQYVCHTKALAEFASQSKIKYKDKEIFSEVSEDSEAQISSVIGTNIHLPQKTHWNLRRRGSSHNSDEPYSAPNGIVAQKTENFQKFYRAVVSPTHVRVTAGGRIVPNTRPTESFGPKSSGEKVHYNATNLESAPVNLQAIAWPQLQPVQARYPVMVPAGLPPPYNVLQTNNSSTFPHLATQSHLGPSTEWNSSETPQIQDSSVKPKVKTCGTTLPQGIKISHPSQFDQTKPFVLNGQLVYPLKTGLQPPVQPFSLPINMFGNPSSMHQSYPSVFQQAPIPTALGNMTNSVAFPCSPHQPLNHHQSEPNVDARIMPQYIPATGMTIPPPDILTDQLQVLSNILNGLEYQMDSMNSHCDGGLLEAQRNSIKSQINSIESALAHHYSEEVNIDKKDNVDRRSLMSDFPTDKNYGLDLTPKVETEQQESVAIVDCPKKAVQTKQSTKSRLSMSSAKAPPFQPRSQLKKEANEKTPNVNPTGATSQTKNSTTRVMRGSIKLKNKNSNSREICSTSFTQSPTELSPVPLSSTYDFSQNTGIPFMGPTAKNLGAPYLVGTFPNGSQYNPTRPYDIVYSRPLTDEEKHARYLYFGQTPRSSQSGLPKFDGKDFYPPSPKKLPHLKSSQSELNKSVECDLIAATSDNHITDTEVRKSIIPHFHSSQSSQNLHSTTQSLPDPYNEDCRTTSLQNTKYPQDKVVFRSHRLEELKHIDRSEQNSMFGSHNLQENVPINSSISRDVENYPNAVRTIHNQNPVVDEHDVPESKASSQGLGKGELHRTNSKIGPQLSPKLKNFSSSKSGNLFAEQVQSFRSANQQTLFLQNMLKRNTPVLPLLGSALSGAITSENACGYLPQYRGSAIASFFPTKLPTSISGVEFKYPINKNSKIFLTGDLPSYDVSGMKLNSSTFNSDQHLRPSTFPIMPVAANYLSALTRRDLNGQKNFIE